MDRNHDGAIDVTELTSALPKAASTTSVTMVAVAIRKYTAGWAALTRLGG